MQLEGKHESDYTKWSTPMVTLKRCLEKGEPFEAAAKELWPTFNVEHQGLIPLGDPSMHISKADPKGHAQETQALQRRPMDGSPI